MQTQTHEAFIASVARIACQRAQLTNDDKAAIAGIKLVYGAGQAGLRGVTYYNRWKGGSDAPKPFVEVCAFGQESWVQVAGTTLHELGHVLAGWEAGHGKGWYDACGRLGLRRIKAAGTAYRLSMFDPALREQIARLPKPDDGEPVSTLTGLNGAPITLKPCGAGIGTRGGKSRGAGSGSRLRLFECECVPPIKVRASRDELDATCNCCRGLFHRT